MSQDAPHTCKGPSPDHSDQEIAGPSEDIIAGQTVTEWTQDWYTWALQAPTSSSPFVAGSRGDGSGGFENGKMFFIGGYDTSQGPLDVYVREGEPILVPLLNFVDTQDPVATEDQYVSQFEQADATLFATLDGEPIDNLQAGLVKTDFFSAGAAQPQSWAVNAGGAVVGSNLAPSEGVGYWIVLQGLSAGTHTLDFGGQTTFNGGFSVHTTDTLHVA